MLIRRFRLHIVYVLFILFIGVVAVIGAIGLGRFYLRIVKEGTVPKYTKVTTDISKSVAAEGKYKYLQLYPIPVYFLQVGVYSDTAGAQEAAEPLTEAGYAPYITQMAPYKIWIGIFQNRSDSEIIKQHLKDKGFGGFTGSIVVNGANLKYEAGRETFIKGITPLLEANSSWLKVNLQLFHVDQSESINWQDFEEQVSVAAEVYKEVGRLNGEFSSNNVDINRGFEELRKTMEEYHRQLAVLLKEKDQTNYQILQCRLLQFIDKYQQVWQQIDNISKT